MNKRMIIVGAALLCCSALSVAQSFTQQAYVVDQGGGRSSGGGFNVDVSIGQAVVGTGEGAAFEVNGGFIPQLSAFSGQRVSSILSLNDGWNMVSVPNSVGDYTREVLFPTAVSDAFTYEISYVKKDTLRNGIGYWVKFSGGQSIPINGLVRTLDTVDVSLGWNMIGSISTAIPVTQITSNPGRIVTSPFYGYAPTGYYQVDTLLPGSGYWVKVDQPGQLILAASSPAHPANAIRIVESRELPPAPPPETWGSDRLLPTDFALDQNYPNPFNPATLIRYAVPTESYVTLRIFNVLGQEVARLVQGREEPGFRSVQWSAETVPSGVYFCSFDAQPSNGAAAYAAVMKMILIK